MVKLSTLETDIRNWEQVLLLVIFNAGLCLCVIVEYE